MTIPTVTPADIRRALLLREEIALLDLRYEAAFATGHPLFAANMAANRIAVEAEVRLPRKDVPVSILSPKDKFMELHEIALSWFGALGARWAEKDPYVGKDYNPHIAQRKGFVIDEGQTIHIGSVTLFKASRFENQVRTVAAKAILK